MKRNSTGYIVVKYILLVLLVVLVFLYYYYRQGILAYLIFLCCGGIITLDLLNNRRKSDYHHELNGYIAELNETKEQLKQKNDELVSYYNEIQTGYFQTVMALANSIEVKDAYTRGHCQRVMEVSCQIAKNLGFNDDEINDLRYVAVLHDIGKIGIPAEILNKEGKLTDDEFSQVKKHPLIAYNILKDVEFIKGGLSGILQHHERYDGRGYPYGLKGDKISVFGRIMCIADAFDAMTSDRPYRKAMPMEAAIEEIERCKGTQFDPEIASLFIDMSRQLIDAEDKKAGL